MSQTGRMKEESGFKRLCSVCHYSFTRLESLGLTWCKSGRHYVCERCWESSCGTGQHGERPKTGGGVKVIILVVLLFGIFALPIGAAGFYEMYYINEANAAPISGIAYLPSEGYIKICGRIGNCSYIALDGHEEEGDDSWSWEWDYGYSFTIDDPTGSVWVYTDRASYIYPAPNASFDARYTDGTAYHKNDRVTVYGELVEAPDVALLHVEMIAPGDGPYPVGLTANLIVFVLLVPFLVLAGIAFYVLRRRSVLHESSLGNARPAPMPKDRAVKSTRVEWIDNRRPLSFISNGPIVIACFIACTALIAWLATVLPLESRTDVYLFACLASMALLGLIMLPLFFYLQSGSRPSEVAIGEGGIYFWYDKPSHRMLNDNYIGWDEIKKVGLVSAGDSSNWAIVMNRGGNRLIDNVKPRTRDAMRDAWKRRSGEL